MSTTLNPNPTPVIPPPDAPKWVAPASSGRGPRPNHRVALILGAAAVVVAGAAVAVGVAVNHGASTGSPTLPPTTVSDTGSISMYLTSYGQGSATYAEQVPAAAARWTDAYAVGSTVYAEQVPTAPAPWTDAYGPGSTVYIQQVPEG